MPLEIITVAVSIIISLLVFSLVLRVLKASLTTAFMIGAILLTMQFFFGIHYAQVWQETNSLIQQLAHIVNQVLNR